MNKNLERFNHWLQEKANFLLVDLEANFIEWKDIEKRETIQFGYIKFDYEFNVIMKGSIFVKPTLYPILSEFIKDFTWITQDQVDNSSNFEDWLQKFMTMYNPQTDYIMSYWYYDMKQIYQDCKINNTPYPFDEDDTWNYSKHINIKNAIAKKLNCWEKWMKKMLEIQGLNLEWKHHNWEDDCLNILKLTQHVFNTQ